MLTEVFGAVAVSIMAISYGLESRSRWFVFVFAVACLASSLYAGLIHAWPFAAVEVLWAGIALRRWLVVGRNLPVPPSSLDY